MNHLGAITGTLKKLLKARGMTYQELGSRFTVNDPREKPCYTQPDKRARGSGSGRYYPAGAMARFEQGVTDLSCVFPLLEALVKWGMPFPVYGEVVDPEVGAFDREDAFIERMLACPLPLAATITSIMNRNVQ